MEVSKLLMCLTSLCNTNKKLSNYFNIKRTVQFQTDASFIVCVNKESQEEEKGWVTRNHVATNHYFFSAELRYPNLHSGFDSKFSGFKKTYNDWVTQRFKFSIKYTLNFSVLLDWRRDHYMPEEIISEDKFVRTNKTFSLILFGRKGQ